MQKEEEIFLLEQLINELNNRLENIRKMDSQDFFLTRKLRLFSDFPNIKEGNCWSFIERKLNIYTVNDLIHANPNEILRCRGFGKKKLEDIKKWMKKYNLMFIE